MGAVGLNFGSATSGQGFDVTTTVNEIVTNMQAVETPWKSQLTQLQAQDTAFTSLGTDLSTLSTDLQALTDFQGVTAAKQGSSSDTNVLSLTSASTTAVAGSHSITVSQLAQTSSEYSNSLASATDTLSGSITVQVGSGTAQTITVGSSSNTLASYAAAINAAAIGVTASVITDSSGSRLSIVSGTSGAAGQLTLTSSLTDATTGSAMAFQVGQTGQDANLSVDGISITSASNTVTNAIPGVTFQLLSAAPATQVQVEITNDNSAVESTFSNLVTAYNKVVTDINTQEGKDASGNPQPLYGNPMLAQLQELLSGALTGGGASGSISSITQLGINMNNDGTLTLNTDTLGTVLNSNYSDVVGYLQNTGSWGQNFSNVLNNLNNQAPYGLVYLALQQNSQQETNLNNDISSEEALISQQKTTLTAELNMANQELQAIPGQLSEISQIYSAITGYNQRTF
ncbi:MAG: flagellar filament capping protein FliD [Acidobacteriaceae bacterium]